MKKETLKEEVARALEQGFADGRMVMQKDIKSILAMLEGGGVEKERIINYIKEYLLGNNGE